MAKKEHVALLKQGVDAWNQWRRENPDVRPDLFKADLRETDLNGADLHDAILINADLREAQLGGADLRKADLGGAHLYKAILCKAERLTSIKAIT